MKKTVFWSSFLIAMLVIVACSPNREAADDSVIILTQAGFGAADQPEETAEATLEVRFETFELEESTEESLPTNTSTFAPTKNPATAEPQNEASVSEINVVQSEECTPRTDWRIYLVEPGDTLSRIAAATGTTTAALAEGNCLSDANTLFARQRIYVPRDPVFPPTSTFTPSPTNSAVSQSAFTITPTYTLVPLGTYGSIIVDGAISIEGSEPNKRFVFAPNSVVTLGWVDYPRNPLMPEIEFVYIPAGQGAAAQVIGTDADITDGVSVTWHVPESVLGQLMVSAAIPNRPNDYVFSPEVTIVTGEAQSPPEASRYGALSISPAIQAGNQNNWSEYILQAGAIVTINWSGYGPTLIQDIESAQFIYRPNDGSGETIIGVDTNISDGSVTSNWVVPLGPEGYLYVKAFRYESAGAGFVLSPELYIIPQQ